MSKVLVVYGTKSGCTQGVAERIGEAFSHRGAAADVSAVDTAPDARGYDAVVVGSGVRAGQWHGPVREWVSQSAPALKERPVAFFTCGLIITQGAEKADEVRAYTDPLIEQSGVSPVDVGLFAGWNEPKRFALPERLIMKVMKAPQGDFRDWDSIDAWAAAIAPKLGMG